MFHCVEVTYETLVCHECLAVDVYVLFEPAKSCRCCGSLAHLFRLQNVEVVRAERFKELV
jgi:hypothetical protein